jgi:DNA-binding beta-propeller fold protein YncE
MVKSPSGMIFHGNHAKTVAFCVVLLLVGAFRTQSQSHDPISPVATISLHKIDSHFDHFGVDVAGGRLFATLQAENVVHVYRMDTGEELHRITGIGRPHAVLYAANVNRIFITDGDHTHGKVHILDGTTYAPLGEIELAPGAEQYSWDPHNHLMYVGNGGHDAAQPYSLISIIDTATSTKISDIRVETPNLEATALESKGNRLYANDRLNTKILVVDRRQRKVLTSWPIPDAQMNVSIAMDEVHHRLFVGCRSGKIVVFDTRKGAAVASLPIGPGIDDLYFDSSSGRIFAASGEDGSLSVYRERDPDHFDLVLETPTGPGGKNGIYVPSLHRYFVGVPQHGTMDTEILSFEIK